MFLILIFYIFQVLVILEFLSIYLSIYLSNQREIIVKSDQTKVIYK